MLEQLENQFSLMQQHQQQVGVAIAFVTTRGAVSVERPLVTSAGATLGITDNAWLDKPRISELSLSRIYTVVVPPSLPLVVHFLVLLHSKQNLDQNL